MTTQPTTAQMIAALRADESATLWERDGMRRYYVTVDDFVDEVKGSKAAARRRADEIGQAKVWYDAVSGVWSSKGCDTNLLSATPARVRVYFEEAASAIAATEPTAPMMTLYEGPNDAPVDYRA